MGFKDFLKRAAKKIQYADDSPGPKTQRNPKLGVREWINTGQWVNVRSSWCSRIRYSKEDSTLTVVYRDGFTADYPGVSSQEATQMFMANSVGGFARRHLYGRPYVGYHS